MADIKETKELLVGVNELSLLLIKHLKDGLQAGQDAMAIMAELMGNEELKAKLQAALEGVGKVGDEVKDLSLAEGVELGMVQVQYVDDLIQAFKKEA